MHGIFYSTFHPELDHLWKDIKERERENPVTYTRIDQVFTCY